MANALWIGLFGAFVVGALAGWAYARSRRRPEAASTLPAVRPASPAVVDPASYALTVGAEGQPDLHRELLRLRERLEEKDLELHLLREDYELDTQVLRQEIEEMQVRDDAVLAETRQALEAERRALQAQNSRLEAEQAEMLRARNKLHERRAALVLAAQKLQKLEQTLKERAAQVAAVERQLHEQARPEADRTEPDRALDAQRRKIESQEQELAALRARLDQAHASLARQPAPAAAPPRFQPLSVWLGDTAADESPTEKEAPPAPQAAPEPEQREALTRLHGISERLQDALYDLGYTSFAHVANLKSQDVRRLSDLLDVPRETIVTHWILEAQALLYEGSRQTGEPR